MGNANSSGSSTIFLQTEVRSENPGQTFSSVQKLPEVAAEAADTNNKKESRSDPRASSRQIRRSASIDGGVFNRLSESFHRISRSLSCTALDPSGHGQQRPRHRANLRNLRPWSRVSRKRWHESTLADEHLLSKTCWPVTKVEALFLPHFVVDSLAESQYTVVEHIANGAFGKVYKVRAVEGERAAADYALKVLSKSEIINSGAIGQLRDEVDIQSICGHHPFLARCVRFWQNKKKVFLLSDYFPNGELFQKFTKFPHELVRLYVAEIALALDFLHQAGIIHRDLKPENVLLDVDFHVRLIDFGFARWLSIGSRTRTICGTLQYMGKALF
uniref:Putative catalytic domain of agc family serine/threonine kinase n=1 Tax=Culex tarsalis TaxID=7177 RepID=A0A1Q3FBS8_CULTA